MTSFRSMTSPSPAHLRRSPSQQRSRDRVERILDAAAAIVDEEVAAAASALGAQPTMRQMGLVMKAVTPRIAGRGDGKTAAALVKAALA